MTLGRGHIGGEQLTDSMEVPSEMNEFKIVRTLSDTEFGFNNERQPIHFHTGQNNVHEEARMPLER